MHEIVNIAALMVLKIVRQKEILLFLSKLKLKKSIYGFNVVRFFIHALLHCHHMNNYDHL